MRCITGAGERLCGGSLTLADEIQPAQLIDADQEIREKNVLGAIRKLHHLFWGPPRPSPPPLYHPPSSFGLPPPTPYRDDVIYERDISTEIYDQFGWELNLLGSRSL